MNRAGSRSGIRLLEIISAISDGVHILALIAQLLAASHPQNQI